MPLGNWATHQMGCSWSVQLEGTVGRRHTWSYSQWTLLKNWNAGNIEPYFLVRFSWQLHFTNLPLNLSMFYKDDSVLWCKDKYVCGFRNVKDIAWKWTFRAVNFMAYMGPWNPFSWSLPSHYLQQLTYTTFHTQTKLAEPFFTHTHSTASLTVIPDQFSHTADQQSDKASLAPILPFKSVTSIPSSLPL